MATFSADLIADTPTPAAAQAGPPAASGGWTVEGETSSAPSPASSTGGWTVEGEPTEPTGDEGPGLITRGVQTVRAAADTVGRFGGQLQTLNPFAVNRFVQTLFWGGMPEQQPIGTDVKNVATLAGPRHMVSGMLTAQDRLRAEAQQAFHRGDYMTAVQKYVDWALPVVTAVGGGMLGSVGGPIGAAAGTAGGYGIGMGISQRMNESANLLRQGKVAEGFGAATDAALMLALPKLQEKAVGAYQTLTAVKPQPELVQFAHERNIGPVDMATQANTEFYRQRQKALSATPGATGVAEQASRAQQESLASAGTNMADEVGPNGAKTMAEAGDKVLTGFKAKIARHNTAADQFYARARGQQGPPPAPPSAPGAGAPISDVIEPDGGFTYHAVTGDQPQTGYAVSPYKGRELVLDSADVTDEQIRQHVVDYALKNWDSLSEPDNYLGVWHNPENGKIYIDVSKVVDDAKTANWIGSLANQEAYFDLANGKSVKVDYSITYPEKGGAHGAGQAAAGAAASGPEARAADRGAPDRAGGEPVGASAGRAGEAANQTAGGGVSGTAQQPPVGMRAPVDLRTAKAALRPYFEEINQTWPIAQKDASPGFVALRNIVEGPNFQSADTVDTELSTLKGIVREAPSALRNRSQGLAALAVSKLDPLVRKAVYEAGGPEAALALQRGRQEVAAKYTTAKVLHELGRAQENPSLVVRTLLRPHDGNAEVLRHVLDQMPEQRDNIARAWVQSRIDLATHEGGFQHTDRLLGDWNRLGPVTKQLVFGNHIKDLDNFFRLAQKLRDNPNKSGTAPTLLASMVMRGAPVLGGGLIGQTMGGNFGAAAGMAAGMVGERLYAYALAKMMFSDRTAGAVLTLMKKANDMPVTPAAEAAATAVVGGELVRMGVPVALPQAAQEPQRQQP